jgi:hypothetical protein
MVFTWSGVGDIADAHCGDLGLVPDLVGEGRLEHAPIDGPRFPDRLPGRDVDEVDARLAKEPRDRDRVVGREPAVAQSVADRRTDIGLSAGQMSRIAANTSSGNRARFSREPPYSSVRRFVRGERKLARR